MRRAALATFAHGQPIFVYQERTMNLLSAQVTEVRSFSARLEHTFPMNLVVGLRHMVSADLTSPLAPSPQWIALLEPRLGIVRDGSCAILSMKLPVRPVTGPPGARRTACPKYRTIRLQQPGQR